MAVSEHILQLAQPGLYAKAWRRLRLIMAENPDQPLTANQIGYWFAVSARELSLQFRSAFLRCLIKPD